MSKLSHRPARRPTVRRLIERAARRLERAGACYGHGTDNAADEAAALIWHALALPRPATARLYARRSSRTQEAAARALVGERIRRRVPAAYLTHEAWFAGLRFYVDERVLIPRSPFAELLEHQLRPWVRPSRVRRILDLGTGSGCIAIAAARAFARARVDAVDVSQEALAVARINVRRHRLGRRVTLLKSDHFAALGRRAYDMILSNPPYVGAREMRTLPPEYQHEPSRALAAGSDGLDCVRVILRQAGGHLRPRGLLVVEVGNSEARVRRAFAGLPFTWLAFERGGGGVFLLTAEQLAAAGARRELRRARGGR
jgi:ribosomal protein L3 glutamine methyltransferase